MTNPYGFGGPQPPPAPPAKSRTPLYIGLACGCLLLLALVAAAIGVGVFVLSVDDDGEPTGRPTTSTSPEEEPTEDAIEAPTEDPSEEPTTTGEGFTVSVSSPEEGTTLETNDGTIETENGKFIGVAVTITNNGTQDIGLSSDKFRFYDTDGQQYRLVFGSFSTSGPQIAPGEEATALLYADVPEDMELESVGYTDEVATGGEEILFPAT